MTNTEPTTTSMLSVGDIVQIINDSIDRIAKQLDTNGAERAELRDKIERLQIQAQEAKSDLKRLTSAREALSGLTKNDEPVRNEVNRW